MAAATGTEALISLPLSSVNQSHRRGCGRGSGKYQHRLEPQSRPQNCSDESCCSCVQRKVSSDGENLYDDQRREHGREKNRRDLLDQPTRSTSCGWVSGYEHTGSF